MRSAHDLFRAPVRRRTQQWRIASVALCDACHAKVGQLHSSVRRDQDVRRFHVAVNHSAGVSHFQRFGCVRNPRTGARQRQCTLCKNAIERSSVNKLHHQVRSLCRFFDSHIVQGNDVGMGQLANDAGFAKETISRFPNREFGAKQFYRHLPPDHWVKSTHYAAGGGFQRFGNVRLAWGTFRSCM